MDDDEAPATDGEALLYDFQKHLTSLCLLSLGGVLALADKVHGKSARSLLIAVGVIGLAAFSSFAATGMIVEARLSGKGPQRSLTLYRHASPLLLAVGVGMFLYLFAASQKG